MSGFWNRFTVSPETHSALVPVSRLAIAGSHPLSFSVVPVWIWTYARVGSSSYNSTLSVGWPWCGIRGHRDTNLRLQLVVAHSVETSATRALAEIWALR